MKARTSSLSVRKRELYESAKARIQKKSDQKAENEIRHAVESMKGVY